MIVAMDGPAGCGKSTIAKLLSQRTGFLYLNSGSLYRAVSYAAIGRGLGIDDREDLVTCARSLVLAYDADGTVVMDGIRRTEELRSAPVEAIVAQVSAIPAIRAVVDAVGARFIGQASLSTLLSSTSVAFCARVEVVLPVMAISFTPCLLI